jgi:hypothetical protein
MLNQCKLKVVFLGALKLDNWNCAKTTSNGCNNSWWVTWNEYKILLESIFRKNKKIFKPSIIVFNVDILSLMNNKLKVYFYIWELLHSLKRTWIPTTLTLLQKVSDWFIEYAFNMVNDILKNFVMDFGEDYDFEKWLDCS